MAAGPRQKFLSRLSKWRVNARQYQYQCPRCIPRSDEDAHPRARRRHGHDDPGLKLNEEGYRGARFDAWNREVRGNNDLLNLSRPDAVRDIHLAYFRAAPMSFPPTPFRRRQLRKPTTAWRISPTSSIRPARRSRVRRRRKRKEDGRRRFVAGALGPTNRTASISPDVANPGFRAISFDQLRTAYGEQVRGLIDGGADLLLIETIFDTLNAKAAIFATSEICDERGLDVPVMISGTITDRSGRLLSGRDSGRVLEFRETR
jgi:5-methyltetrahydrofolate--homocysteine methyltransferase